MKKTAPTDKTATPAGQNDAGADQGPLLPVRVTTNGVLYAQAHHAKGKSMSIPKKDAEELQKQGHVEILPGLG